MVGGRKIENIVTDLQLLEEDEEGKDFADRLKMEYWCDKPLEIMIGNLSSLRSKYEISQRFYLFEDQNGISVEEAYRFLHNRWMEKQLQAKRKQIDALSAEKQIDNGNKNGPDKELL